MAERSSKATKKERRREEPEVRRAQILEAARSCFASFGFQGTSVDRIAAGAEVSVGLLYRFFESKAAIVKAIIIEDVDAQVAQLKEAIDSGSLDAGGVAKLATRGLREASSDPRRMAMMFEISAEICRNRELRAFVQERHSRLSALLRDELISKGVDAEAADKTLHRVDLVSAIVTALGTRAVLHSGPLSTSVLDDVQLLIDGIFALEGKPPRSAGK
jgi:TetR/AcrR family transcriptional regulator, repressor for uid operon